MIFNPLDYLIQCYQPPLNRNIAYKKMNIFFKKSHNTYKPIYQSFPVSIISEGSL